MTAIVVIFAAACVAIATVASIARQSLTEIAWHELEEYCREHQRPGTFDEIHDRHESVIESAEAVQTVAMVTATLLAATAFVSRSAEQEAGGSNLVGVSLGALFIAVVLAATNWFPREIARFWGPEFVTHTWPIWRWLDHALWPLHAVATWVRVVTKRLDGNTPDSSEEEALEDEILSIVTEAQHDGLLEDDVREMIAGVIELDDSNVADVMTPRSEMDVISVETPWPDVLRFVVQVGRTRIPVIDKNLDDVVGLLYVKDLLAFMADPSRTPRLAEIIRPVRNIPETTRLDELLQNFLHTRNHLAMVVDEFMHVVGLVTIEDVLEEIVGEIVDESDPEEPSDLRWLAPKTAEVYGRAHVEEVNEMMGVHLPTSDEYDTIGGFVLHEFGRIPEQGETLKWDDLRLTVVQASKRRIERVTIAPADVRPATGDAGVRRTNTQLNSSATQVATDSKPTLGDPDPTSSGTSNRAER